MIYNSLFTALLDLKNEPMPVFIPTFNQPSLLISTLEQLSGRDLTPVIVDNNSTYEPMIEFLDRIKNDAIIIKLSRNAGPRIFTEDSQILGLMPRYFIVTDPDLIYNKSLPKNFVSEMKKVMQKNRLAKVGFALEIDDVDEMERFQDAEKVHQWEKPYWETMIDQTSTSDPVYAAWIDTTFSLNDRDACIYHRKFKKPTFRYPSARIAGKYTCQHVGWWKKDLIPQPQEEVKFYLDNQKWSHTENYYYK